MAALSWRTPSHERPPGVRWSRAADPLVATDRHGERQEMHRTIDLDAMLAIERQTGKR